MGKKKTDFFKKHAQLVEAYLAGERDNPLICTTDGVAEKLERRYGIVLARKEAVNPNIGLYMFEIQP